MPQIANQRGNILPSDVDSTVRYYEQHAQEYFDSTVGADLSALRSRFTAMLPPGARILDAGCGSGRDLAVFAKQGFAAVGLDASPALVELARRFSGAPCLVGRLEEIEWTDHFDGIWACASLLHLPKATAGAVLRRFRRALASKGALYASVRDGEGESLGADGRFFANYRLEEFSSLVQEAGFSIVDTFGSDSVIPRRTAVRWINLFAIAGKTDLD